MVSVVLDTVIFVRALLNPRGRWGRLIFDRADEYWLIVSSPVLDEILEVLDRPALTRNFRYVAGLDKARVLARLAAAERVELPVSPPLSRDPKDDKFLLTAQAGNADFIVTEDKDLLVLGTHGATRIVDAVTFLNLLDEQQAITSDLEGT